MLQAFEPLGSNPVFAKLKRPEVIEPFFCGVVVTKIEF